MQCQHCGTPIADKRQKYCPNCGAQLRSSAVPTILGCGLSVLLGLLGVGIIAVCGALAFFATCAYGLSNNSGPKPDTTPFEIGAAIGGLLIFLALASLVFGIVNSWRGSKWNKPVAPPQPPMSPLPQSSPLSQQHLWVSSPPTESVSDEAQPSLAPVRPTDNDPQQAQPGE